MKIFRTLAFLTVVATVVAVATAATAIIQESQFDAYLTEEEAISSFQVILDGIHDRETIEIQKKEAAAESNSNSNSKGGEDSAADVKKKGSQALDVDVLTAEEKAKWKNDYCKKDIIASIGKGRWQLSEKLIVSCLSRGYKVSSPIYKISGYIRKKLTQMQNLMSFKPEKTLKAISPALQWGQSADYVFINVKFGKYKCSFLPYHVAQLSLASGDTN